VRYNRDLVQTTLKAMSRISEIRARRERAFYKARMKGNKERQRAEDRKLVEENQHLLPLSERFAVVDTEGMEVEEVDVQKVREKVQARRKEIEEDALSEEEEVAPKMVNKSKRKLKMKVGGGVEAMDVDD
jgi:large subunit ribosomal protein L24e